MTDHSPGRGMGLRDPRSTFLVWLNLAVTFVVAAIGFGLGFAQGLSAQVVILYTLDFRGSSVLAHQLCRRSCSRAGLPRVARGEEAEIGATAVGARGVWRGNRVLIVAMAVLLLAYLIVTASVPDFRTITNLIAFLVLEAILVFAFKVSNVFAHGRSAFIGLIVLFALIVISSFTIDGFLSGANVKAILLFAAFLGIACVGQTLVALLGGLDLSIPFVIGASNIGLLYLIGLGVPSVARLPDHPG